MDMNGVLDRIKRQFGDESGVQVQTSDVINWVNDAQNEAYMQISKLKMTSNSINLIAGTQIYTLPANMIDLQSVSYKQLNTGTLYPLTYQSEKQMHEYNPGWFNTDETGTPQYYVQGVSSGTISLYPVPDTTGDSILIVYGRTPTDVVDLTSPIDLPIYMHPYVVEFCLMKAYEMDEEWEVADRKAAYIQSTLDFNNARSSWFSQEVYPSVQPSSEDLI